MDSIYIVVGSRGVVGSQIVQRLKCLGKLVAIITTTEILQTSNIKLTVQMANLCHEASIDPVKARVGLILAHRYRGINIQCALSNELCITRDFVWSLSRLCASLRVVVLGSITGSLVDRNLPEAYHYSKDLQKSIVRQSIRINNLCMNLLELNWFEKYPEGKRSNEYRQIMANIKQQVGGDSLPTVDSITDFSCALIELPHPPRGQIIVYDGGFSLYQK